jgi:hypothetical protein
MVARSTVLIALVGVLGPAWQSSAHAQDSEALVEQYLKGIGATGYTITAVTADYIDDSFPDTDFFEVRFRQYPVGVTTPEGLSASNLFLVQNGTVFPLVRPADLKDFFFDELSLVRDEDHAKDAGLAWLRLSEAFSQDGFFTFAAPQVKVTTSNPVPRPDQRRNRRARVLGKIRVTGSVTVTAGGRGSISVEMDFDSGGALDGVSETRKVLPGVRPICQATKLLDADPLTRRMAEKDILVMGKSAKEYLDEQRAKAKPDLKAAIDRIWNRIVNEGW